jgi:hypothetical protein
VIGLPTINHQIEAMRRTWPMLRAERLDNRTAQWRGPLRPLLMSYEVEILYRVPLIIERIDPMRQQPDVRVLSPVLKRRSGSSEGPLPHVYWDDAARPALCLFDAEAGEWSPADLLSETTIPWALDWLACYEGWRATGEWTGGGRHAPPRKMQGAAP